MRKIEEMITTGVKEEVSTVLKPLQDRIDKQERVVGELTRQLTSVMKEMETLKQASVSSSCDFPILPQPTSSQPSQPIQQHPVHVQQAVQVEGPVRGVLEESGAGRYRVKEICSDARRVIRFTPIEPMMLEIQMQSYGAKDIQNL